MPSTSASGFSDIPIIPTHAIDSTLEESLHSQSHRPPDMLRDLLEIILDSRRENETQSKAEARFSGRNGQPSVRGQAGGDYHRSSDVLTGEANKERQSSAWNEIPEIHVCYIYNFVLIMLEMQYYCSVSYPIV